MGTPISKWERPTWIERCVMRERLVSAALAAKIDRNEDLRVVALNQQSHGLRRLRHQRAQLRDRLDRGFIDCEPQVASVYSGTSGRTAYFLDHQPLRAGLLSL